jgi:LuxR family maltose regulon positive regulatory protein
MFRDDFLGKWSSPYGWDAPRCGGPGSLRCDQQFERPVAPAGVGFFEGFFVPDQLQSLVVLKAQPPVVSPDLVRRGRLEAQLSKGASQSFTLVSAGPGAGKTFAVAAWAASGAAPGPVAWLSLDMTDNDPRTFWWDLLQSVIGSGAVPDDHALRDIIPAATFGAVEAREVRARLAELPTPVVLVLDDFHEITSDAVLEAFGQLVDHLPDTIRLVMLTRADPMLRLHRLRVGGQLTEIRTTDLAFTEQEAAELFDLQGIHLQREQLAILRSRTQGWSAGLRLAAMSLDPADIDDGITRFSGNERAVADYLVGEVIDRLSAVDRDFLLSTSITEKLNGDLADALTGRSDGQSTLEKLAGANAFVVALGGQNEWFGYHPLLRELLRHRVVLEQPTAVAALHERAAAWMARRGEPIESVRHSILAGDLQGAGATLLSVIPRILSVEGPSLAAAIEPLARTASSAPTFSALLASATVHFHRFDYPAMLHDATEARQFLDEAADDVRPSAEVLISLFEMAGARMRGDASAVAILAGRVIDDLDRTPRRQIPAGRHFRAVAENNLGGAKLWAGDLAAADQILAATVPATQELELPLTQLNAIGHRAVIEALQGRCRQAHRRALEGIDIVDRRGWASEPQALASFLALGLVELARHRPVEAAAHINRGLTSSGDHTDRSLRLALAVAAVELAVLRGDADAALAADARLRAGLGRTQQPADLLVRWAAVAGSQALLLAERPTDVAKRIGRPGDGAGFAASWERVVLARAQLAMGNHGSGLDLIEPLLEPGWPYREAAIQARLIEATVADRQHRDTAALTAVTTAVDLAQSEGIRRPFLVRGARLSALLLRYQHLGGRHAGFVADIVDNLAPAGSEPEAAAPMVEHLTERELIVLRYLPTMLKAGEIAADLYVSVNTVKAHLRSMYRKLGVSNRREAVERARSIGLL